MKPPGFSFSCGLVLLSVQRIMDNQSTELFHFFSIVMVCICVCVYLCVHFKKEKKTLLSVVWAKSQRRGVAGWYFTTVCSFLFIRRKDKCIFCCSYLQMTVGSLGTTVSWHKLEQSPGQSIQNLGQSIRECHLFSHVTWGFLLVEKTLKCDKVIFSSPLNKLITTAAMLYSINICSETFLQLPVLTLKKKLS